MHERGACAVLWQIVWKSESLQRGPVPQKVSVVTSDASRPSLTHVAPPACCSDPPLLCHLVFSVYPAGETFSLQWAMPTEGADTGRGRRSFKHPGAQTHWHIVGKDMLLILFFSVSFSVTKQHNSKSSFCLFVLSLWCPLENGTNMQGKLWDTLLLILGGMSPSSRLLNVSF